MDGAHDILIKFCVISNKANTFVVPFRHKKAGEHQSVGSSHGTMIPEAICLAISDAAGSWKRRGIGQGADTQYGTALSLIKNFIRCAHVGLLSKESENTKLYADNVFIFRSW